jgi:regulator of protease activity HflC (stomatin/prohibitin superfamily)
LRGFRPAVVMQLASAGGFEPRPFGLTGNDLQGRCNRGSRTLDTEFALREAIGSRTLDELLGAKGELDREIQNSARSKIEEHGIRLASVGIKDVILPGEMKEILNRVVEAEKVAQANLIKRREETAATRSLLNTARLMDENPTLLRLKELETLEKVTEKVDKLTVFGGLDGVLKDVVRIQVPAN